MRLLYIRQLNCVRWLYQQMVDPKRNMNVSTQTSYGPVMSYSFLRQIAHYICPSDQLDLKSVKCASLRILAQVCKLWQL